MTYPIPRRGFLRIGSLLLGGLGLRDLLELRAQAAPHQAKTSVILLWLEGGASHLETYDLKPNAPKEIRGDFRPIRSNVPGIDVCEHLPLHARIADKFTLIRSIAHRIPDHPGAAGRFLTGHIPANISDPISKFPTVDAVAAKHRYNANAAVPPFVSNVLRVKGGGNGYLGPESKPFLVEGEPGAADFKIDCLTLSEENGVRLNDRFRLLSSLDRVRRRLDSVAERSFDRYNRQALNILLSSRTRDAFDLSREPASLRERYGRHPWGQRALLARRLVEAGCSFVTMQLTGGGSNQALVTWDDHGDVGHIFNSMRFRLPILDRCVSALIDDLYARGLDRRVLLIVAGEFGRTPKLNMGRAATPKWPGRDHWPWAMSVLVSGGGLRMGQVIGATNSHGEEPRDRPLEPNDFLATIYRYLGIDPTRTLTDTQGRPNPILPHGRPISELIG